MTTIARVLAERRNRRATVTALQAELAATNPGSARHAAIIEDLVEYERAGEQDGVA